MPKPAGKNWRAHYMQRKGIPWVYKFGRPWQLILAIKAATVPLSTAKFLDL